MAKINYARLTADERVRMWLAAEARGDEAEASALIASAHRMSVRTVDLEVRRRLDAIFHAGSALRVALVGYLQCVDHLTRLVASSGDVPDDFDNAGYQQVSVAAMFVGNFVDRGSYHLPVLDGLLERQALDPAIERGDGMWQLAKDAAEYLIGIALLDANACALGVIEGAVQWSEMVEIDGGDFLAQSCPDLLDHLDRLRPAVADAAERVKQLRDRAYPSLAGNEFDPTDPERVDHDGAAAFASILRESLPTLMLRCPNP
jgi:hypothetical protein